VTVGPAQETVATMRHRARGTECDLMRNIADGCVPCGAITSPPPGVQPVSHAAYLLPQRRQKKKCTGYRDGSASWW
jgi:hypothetical protein